jgi:hypothetical protein
VVSGLVGAFSPGAFARPKFAEDLVKKFLQRILLPVEVLRFRSRAKRIPLDWVQTIEVLPRQHIIVFQKRPFNLSY